MSSAGIIAVVDDGGNLMYLERLDTTFPAGAAISTGKARTAALFKRPSKAFEEVIKNGRTAMVALSDFTPLQGGEPIVVDGQIVGAVGVSGATSADADEQIALAGARALTSPAAGAGGSGSIGEAAATPPVLYFGHDQVKSSFARGGVLVDGAGVRNYMIHTSRRDANGMAEVHARDTDIIYVTGGTATLLTGGSVVDGRPTATDELRGAGITGGESRRLREGDVIVVPHGVPHQFQDVHAAFTYYTVKVR
jgi:glc operon protein GlcG